MKKIATMDFNEVLDYVVSQGYQFNGPEKYIPNLKFKQGVSPWWQDRGKYVPTQATKLEDFQEYYDNGNYDVGLDFPPVHQFDDDGLGYDINFGFDAMQSSTSCAIPNIGNFTLNSNIPVEIHASLLRVCCIRHEHQGYIQCVTLDTDDYDVLNAALPLAGFKEVKRVPTHHAGENYMNIIWEWKS